LIIVWKRRGHIAITLPAAALFVYGLGVRSAVPTAPPVGSQLSVLVAALLVVYLGFKWNHAEDVEYNGKHLFFGIPVEYLGMALFLAEAVELAVKRL